MSFGTQLTHCNSGASVIVVSCGDDMVIVNPCKQSMSFLQWEHMHGKLWVLNTKCCSLMFLLARRGQTSTYYIWTLHYYFCWWICEKKMLCILISFFFYNLVIFQFYLSMNFYGYFISFVVLKIYFVPSMSMIHDCIKKKNSILHVF